MCPPNLKYETPQTRMQYLINRNPSQEDNGIPIAMNQRRFSMSHQQDMNGPIEHE